ncbi:MAG: HEAT repeat domain-containing protein [Acidobacteriota bacterium]
MVAVLLALLTMVSTQASQGADATAVRTAVVQLGSFDFPTRTNAARVVRRAPAALTVPILQNAVQNSTDEYVQFRALVLLTSIDGQAAATTAAQALSTRNDRVRAVAYQWFEHHPQPDVLPKLLAALSSEQSEFTRPSLTRALAASGADPRVREALTPLVTRGEDIYRGAVIEALGDYEGGYALAPITAVAELDGPLQDDAITALGRIGDASSRALLARLQERVAREMQPTVSAALCLQGIDCDARLAYLTSTLDFAASNPGYEALLRGAVHGLAVLASSGNEKAMAALFDIGVRVKESARGPIALGVGLVALRRAEVVMTVLAARPDAAPALELLRDAFDMLSEDFEEERFAFEVRKMLAAPAGDARRRLAERVLTELEY